MTETRSRGGPSLGPVRGRWKRAGTSRLALTTPTQLMKLRTPAADHEDVACLGIVSDLHCVGVMSVEGMQSQMAATDVLDRRV